MHGHLTKYTVKYSTTVDPDNDNDQDTTTSTTTQLIVSDLQPNTEYQFKVAGVTKDGVGEYSLPVKSRTKRGNIIREGGGRGGGLVSHLLS